MIRFKGLIAPCDVPTGDGRMFAPGKMTHRPLPIPLMAQFGSGGHNGAVPVGKINTIYPGPGGYWGEGVFLDPAHVPEVPKAVYMLQEKVMGPSVDLDRDYTLKAVPHPHRPDKKAALFEEYNVIGVTLVPMPAFYQVHMSVETEQEKTLLASAGVNTELFLEKNAYDMAVGSELVYAPSFEETDKAECGCADSDSSEFAAQEMVPMTSGDSAMEPVANISVAGNTVSVGAAATPSSITVTFGQPGFNMYYPPMPGNPVTTTNPPAALMDKPVAVVKVMEDKTVVKVPHENSDSMCHFVDGKCMTCGY